MQWQGFSEVLIAGAVIEAVKASQHAAARYLPGVAVQDPKVTDL